MFAFSKKTTASPANRFRPEVQALEDRQVLSLTSTFSAGTLTLRGDAKADRVTVSHDGNGLVTYSGTGLRTTMQSGVTRLVIDTRGGRDTVSFTQTGNLVRDFSVDVRLGDGADAFTGVLQGDIVAGRTMSLNVQGGDESDLVTVDASQDVDVQAGARLLVNLDAGGGSTTDKMAFVYRGELDGTLNVGMTGSRGANVLTASVGLDAGSTGQVGDTGAGSRMDGGRGPDRLTFLVSDSSGASINAEMDGGAQDDVGTHTTNVRTSEVETNNVVNFQ
jgi:hypothetical protein